METDIKSSRLKYRKSRSIMVCSNIYKMMVAGKNKVDIDKLSVRYKIETRYVIEYIKEIGMLDAIELYNSNIGRMKYLRAVELQLKQNN